MLKLYYQNQQAIGKLTKQIVRKKKKLNFKLPFCATTSGRYDKGVKIKFHRSLWIMYPKILLYIINLFLKKKIFFLDAVFALLKLANANKDYLVHCYLFAFYFWFFYVLSCEYRFGPSIILSFEFIERLFNFILLWCGLS